MANRRLSPNTGDPSSVCSLSYCLFPPVLGVDLRALHMFGKCSATGLCPQSFLNIFARKGKLERTGCVVQVIQHLPSKCEAVSSHPSIT
jgi:hypothetical protein